MASKQTVISLDPIDRKKQKGIFGRLLITRYGGGKPIIKNQPYGHYMFCGPQGSGKTASALWYAEWLKKKYKKKKISWYDEENDRYVKYDKPPRIKMFSNINIGTNIKKEDIFKTIDSFDPYANEIRIVYLDEVHTYFPRGTSSKATKELMDDLIALFSQLRKRNTFILSTAQVYGRLEKSLREQCLYMVDCKVSMSRKLINDFIPGDNIMCDDLGRWAGDPKYIYKHGLPKSSYDTKRIIRE